MTLKRHGDRLSPSQINRLVQTWLESELDEAEDIRALNGPFSDRHLEEQLDGLDIMQEEASEALIGCDYRRVGS